MASLFSFEAKQRMVSDQILQFYFNLSKPQLDLPEVFTMNPYELETTRSLVKKFYTKYYDDNRKRIPFIGINPGRFGSGLTGIGFTDPVNLKEYCGIENDLDQKHELSSKFIYDVIEASGGPELFYREVFITSVVPLGFTKDGINLNYYDIPALQNQLEKYILNCFQQQLSFLRTDVAFCIGKGKNYAFLKRFNEKYQLFDEIKVLPHPRWVMQYRLKRKLEFIDEYLAALLEHPSPDDEAVFLNG